MGRTFFVPVLFSKDFSGGFPISLRFQLFYHFSVSERKQKSAIFGGSMEKNDTNNNHTLDSRHLHLHLTRTQRLSTFLLLAPWPLPVGAVSPSFAVLTPHADSRLTVL
jgi:hypothetical protein